MRILGIETSCDETSVAVVEDGTRVLCNRITSMQDEYAHTGGVIPEDAARKQLEAILPVLHAALAEAGAGPEQIEAIAVTRGPGLLGSLLVGTTCARLLSSLWEKPLIGVHHTLGHLSSTWLDCNEQLSFPILTLSASGGHTDLWYRTSHTKGTLLGSTRDDAAGEAFDKGSSVLELPYPGGPSIARAAEEGDKSIFTFPKPLNDDDTLDFSFSGLKTALKYTLADLEAPLDDVRNDLAASFQHGICLHLIDRIERAVAQLPAVKEIHLVGGVSANTHLRSLLAERVPQKTLRHPQSLRYCTDNAAMIAAAGYFMHQENGPSVCTNFETRASLSLEEVVVD